MDERSIHWLLPKSSAILYCVVYGCHLLAQTIALIIFVGLLHDQVTWEHARKLWLPMAWMAIDTMIRLNLDIQVVAYSAVSLGVLRNMSPNGPDRDSRWLLLAEVELILKRYDPTALKLQRYFGLLFCAATGHEIWGKVAFANACLAIAADILHSVFKGMLNAIVATLIAGGRQRVFDSTWAPIPVVFDSTWAPIPVERLTAHLQSTSVQERMREMELNSTLLLECFSEGDVRRQDKCAICLETLGFGGKSIRTTRCRHSFHSSCVDRWLATRGVCPECRQSLALARDLRQSGNVRQSGTCE
jgi:hypothetical protein